MAETAFVAGAVAGSAGVFIGHPFDTIKIQLQTKLSFNSYGGTLDAIRKINNQGLSGGFLRGLSFPLLSYGVVNSVFFGTESHCKEYLDKNYVYMSQNMKSFTAGSLGGAFQWFVACPIENVKVILQSQINVHPEQNVHFFKGPIDCTEHLLKSSGISGLYKGGISMLFRDIPATGVYFCSYSYMCRTFNQMNFNKDLTYLFAGGIAGSLSWFFLMPIDIVKSQLQADHECKMHSNFSTCVSNIYRIGGIKGFFTGSVITCTRAFFVNSLIFFSYEHILQILNNDNKK